MAEVAGAETARSKVEKIHALLARFPGQEVYWYVGDTAGDIREAREAGVTPLGVAWGWHEPEMLMEAGAERIAASPAELLDDRRAGAGPATSSAPADAARRRPPARRSTRSVVVLSSSSGSGRPSGPEPHLAPHSALPRAQRDRDRPEDQQEGGHRGGPDERRPDAVEPHEQGDEERRQCRRTAAMRQ